MINLRIPHENCQKSVRSRLGMVRRPCEICGTGPCREDALTGGFAVLVDEQLAIDSVVDTARALDKAISEFGVTPSYIYEAAQAMHDAVAALDAARTPVQAEPVKRCEPPDWATGEMYHWLEKPNGTKHPFEWSGSEWFFALAGTWNSPETVAADGWTWHSAAKPSPMVEPTDEEIMAAFEAWKPYPDVSPKDYVPAYARMILSRFTRPTVEISDEEIINLFERIRGPLCRSSQQDAVDAYRSLIAS